jgi:uncharacterized integral membrane protein
MVHLCSCGHPNTRLFFTKRLYKDLWIFIFIYSLDLCINYGDKCFKTKRTRYIIKSMDNTNYIKFDNKNNTEVLLDKKSNIEMFLARNQYKILFATFLILILALVFINGMAIYNRNMFIN